MNFKEHTNAWFDVLETSLSQIPQQSKRTLTHFWHFVLNGKTEKQKGESCDVSFSGHQISGMLHTFTDIHLHALVHEGQDVATSDQLFNGASQTLRQSTEEIQSYDHEVFVRGLILVWLGLMKLEE